ncbi:MAG: hypothetical protein H0W46_09455 [Acidimicrobiia bacterium]|nr:hypothetical protein [Acidimicrobiia bacterium]
MTSLTPDCAAAAMQAALAADGDDDFVQTSSSKGSESTVGFQAEARDGRDVLMTLSIDVTSDDTRPGLMSVAVARESWFELAGFDVMMMPPLVIDELGAEMAVAGSMGWTLMSYWNGRRRSTHRRASAGTSTASMPTCPATWKRT